MRHVVGGALAGPGPPAPFVPATPATPLHIGMSIMCHLSSDQTLRFKSPICSLNSMLPRPGHDRVRHRGRLLPPPAPGPRRLCVLAAAGGGAQHSGAGGRGAWAPFYGACGAKLCADSKANCPPACGQQGTLFTVQLPTTVVPSLAACQAEMASAMRQLDLTSDLQARLLGHSRCDCDRAAAAS